MTTIHNKLVRDLIPEIIQSSGKTCVTRRLSDVNTSPRWTQSSPRNWQNIRRTNPWRSWLTCWRL